MFRTIVLSVAFLFGTALFAQDKVVTTKEETPKEAAAVTDEAAPEMAMKEHVCTAACKEGAHAYACGEKGHVCGAACHEAHEGHSKAEMKEHVCSAACTKEAHAYACGEKGHVCSAACHKK